MQARIKLQQVVFWVPVLVLLTCIICLVVSEYKHEVRPFPYCYITETATPTPQNILFRMILLPCGVLMGLIWVTIYYILKEQAQQLNVQISVPDIILFLGWGGIPLFDLAVATIDTKDMIMWMHQFGAIGFFAFWIINMLVVAIAYTQLKTKDPKIITDLSLILKWILPVSTFIVAILCLLLYLYTGETEPAVPIIEWYGMLTLCLYLLTFILDWDGYYYNLSYPKTLIIDSWTATSLQENNNQNWLLNHQQLPIHQYPSQTQMIQKIQDQQLASSYNQLPSLIESQYEQVNPRIRLLYVTLITPILVFGTCLICLFVAEYNHEVKPFPFCYITTTATPTPQNILFRMILLPGGVFMGLI